MPHFEAGAPQQRPKKPTAWDVIMNGVIDQRCRLKDVHIHDVLHALGINPSAPWPPETDDLNIPTIDDRALEQHQYGGPNK